MTRFMHPLSLVLSLLALAAVSACSRGTVFGEDGNYEEKPRKPDEEATADGLPREMVFKGFYNFIIRRQSDQAIVCSGDAEIMYYSDMQTETIGLAQCNNKLPGVQEIDLGAMVNGRSTKIPTDELIAQGLDPRVTRITSDGRTVYTPNKPDLVGPLIQNVEDYADIDFTQEIEATYKSDDPKVGTETGSGTMRVKVIDAGIPYQPPGYTESFANVLHWGLYSQGFETIKAKADAKLYTKFEYYWNVKPIIILGVHIEGPVSDFERGALKSWAGNNFLIKGLIIDLHLKDFIHQSVN